MTIQVSGNVQLGVLMGGPSSLKLSDLNDVSIVAPQTGQYLRYNGSISEWQNAFIDSDVFAYLNTNLTGSSGITVTKTPGPNTIDISMSLAATGDATGVVSAGTLPLTLATVNPNVGTFGSGSVIPQITVDGKGRITGVVGIPFSGTAATANALATARNITASGDASWTVLFDGSADVSSALTLATVNSNVGQFAAVTVNGKGLVTSASALSGDATTSGATLTLATVNPSPQADTFRKVTVNGKGLVTATSAVSPSDITTALGFTPVNVAGDTMTGYLILNADPVSALGAVTKQYADNIASGLNLHASCVTSSVAPLPSSTYNNGISGVGATITSTVNVTLGAVGGFTPSVNDRVLIKDQVSALENGIYVVTDIGSGGTPWILTRAADFDGAPASEIGAGDFTFIESGTLANTQWAVTTTGTITVGTTPINFTQLSGGGSTYTAGTGIDISSNIISNLGVLSNIAGTGISVSGPTGNVTITNAGVTSAVAGTNISVSAATGAVTFSVTGTVPSASSATNLSAGAAGTVVYQSATGTTAYLAAGTTSQVLVGGASAPSWSNTPTLTGTNFSGIPNGALTNSSITVGSTNIALGATTTTLAGLSSVTSTTFVGALTGNASTATDATNAANTGITNDTTTNATKYVTWVDATSGNNAQKVSSTKLSFNPSTGTLTSTAFSGSGAGLTNIPNSALTNNSLTIGSTTIALGATALSLAGLVDITSTGNTVLGNAVGDTLNVAAGSLQVDASGNVGIGRAPSYALDTYRSTGNVYNNIESGSASSVAVATRYANATRAWQVGVGPGLGNDSFTIYDQNAATVRLQIDNAGNVGISKTPTQRLDISLARGSIQTNESPTGINWRLAAGSGYGAAVSLYDSVAGLSSQYSFVRPPATDAMMFWRGDYFAGTGSELMRIDASGNVMIGTTSPAGKFRIDSGANPWATFGASSLPASYMQFYKGGTTTVGGYLGFDGGALLGTGTGTGYVLRSEADLILMSAATERVRINSTGNVTIAAPSSGNALMAFGGSQVAAFLNTAGGAVNAGITFGSPGSNNLSAGVAGLAQSGTSGALVLQYVTGGALTEGARIDTVGNFGIGAAPTFKLDVSSNANSNAVVRNVNTAAGGAAHASVRVETAATGGNPYVYYIRTGTYDWYTGIDAADNFFKIGTGSAVGTSTAVTIASTSMGINTSPATTLHVKGGTNELIRAETTIARGSGQATIQIRDPSGTKGYFGYGSANDNLQVYNGLNANLDFFTNASLALSIASTAAATFNGAVQMPSLGVGTSNGTAGSIYATGDITAFSDAKLKTDVQVIPDALNKVLAIRGVTFLRTDIDTKKRHAGVIAQEVEKVLPEVVSESDDGTKGVAYGNMVGLLIEAIKELKAEVNALKVELVALRK